MSNREPYLHNVTEADASRADRTGGVAVALDALMRERGGTWIAQVPAPQIADGRVNDKIKYLRSPGVRAETYVDSAGEFAGYYGGFANEGLWPLCHLVDVRPKFRSEDWAAYKKVNAQFASAIDREMLARYAGVPSGLPSRHDRRFLRRSAERAHCALLAYPLAQSRSAIDVPVAARALAGLLANDLLAFQVERDRRNFLLAAEDELGAEIEADGTGSGSRAGRPSYRYRSAWTTTAFSEWSARVRLDRNRQTAPDVRPGLGTVVGVGVDRLDYTKGIPERLEASIASVAVRSRWAFHFVQIGVPSRSQLESYGAIESEIDRKAEEVNAKHAIPAGRGPSITTSTRSASELVALYRLAHFCVVSSLADGMNLVAKEFVASRDDEDGVLVLSALAGAAEELREALIINPYDVDGFANALTRAIDMNPEERRLRMKAMRRIVAGRNVFSWASDILEGLESLWTKPLRYRGPRSGGCARLRNAQRLSGPSFSCSSRSASRRTASRHSAL